MKETPDALGRAGGTEKVEGDGSEQTYEAAFPETEHNGQEGQLVELARQRPTGLARAHNDEGDLTS